MKSLFFIVIVVLCMAEEKLLVTRESTEELKKRVTWEVVDYDKNIFKGWTVEEFKRFVGKKERLLSEGGKIPEGARMIDVNAKANPATVDRTNDKCTHAPRDQGGCGCCWAFTAAGIMSDYCCALGTDYGWLAPQELLSCVTANLGCNGGTNMAALEYAKATGMVQEACFPYLGNQVACPNICTTSKAWDTAHVCKCKSPVYCGQTFESWKSCLVKGPMGSGMTIYGDFSSYSGGVYCWDGTSEKVGDHAVRCTGYSDTPTPHLKCANSWGPSWGEAGFFRISTGAKCGLMFDDNDWVICDSETSVQSNGVGTLPSFSYSLSMSFLSISVIVMLTVLSLFV